jgi:mRNA interferase HigB
MRVISLKRLREFWATYPDAEQPLWAWYAVALKADWSSLQDVRMTFRTADGVTLHCDLVVTVFNIRGNNYRLVTRIVYEYRLVYVSRVMTHKEYSKEKWKAELCREHERSK